MTQDELDILTHFRAHPKAWVSIPELAKQLGGKHRFAQDPDWPRPFVKKCTNKNLLEMDASGAFRVKPKKPPENRGPRIFLTPEIKEALRRSGKKWQFDMDDEIPADEYELYLRTGRLQMGMKSSA